MIATSHVLRRLATLAVAGLLCPLAALAAFPEKPITIVVPYPPGGAADVLGRIVGVSSFSVQ